MRKVLLATTALVAMTGAVSADVAINGSYEFGYNSVSDDQTTDTSDYNNNAEIHVSFSSITDSGLEFGAKTEFDQLEGDGGDVLADENSMYISGDFGKIVMGNNDPADESFATGAVGVGLIAAADDFQGNLTGANGTTLVGVGSGMAYGHDDMTKVSYFSPNLGGFSFGVSHADDSTNETDISIGFAWSGDIAGSSVTIGGGNYDDGESTATEVTHMGITISSGDVSLGFNNAVSKDGTNETVENTYGIAYTVNDQLTVSVGGASAENDIASGDEVQIFGVGGKYTVASGLAVAFGFDSFENTDGSLSTTNEGTVASVAVQMSF
ncbi:porin [Alphaproteobacteria bacterium]|nr:porin [Alphaproteobacteria bacterium]